MRSYRSTNSLDPEYFINGMHYKEKFQPKPMKKFIPDSMLLKTRDINYPVVDLPPRREFRNTNFVKDIEGAHADTIHHGITSNRDTNPLLPVYQALDPGETLDNPVTSLIPAELIKLPTFKPSKNLSTSQLPGSFTPASTGILNSRRSSTSFESAKRVPSLNIAPSSARSSRSEYESAVQSVRDLP